MLYALVDYSNKMSKQIYKIDYSMLFNNIYYLVFSFLYFVLFAYFTNGQTLGKKLFKLKVVRQDGEKVKLSNLMLRTLLSGSSIFMGVNIIVVIQLLLLMIPQNQAYFYAILFSSMISYIIEIIGLVLLFSKEHRSLDDIIGSTKVIDEVKYV